ncbi:chorismate synthase [Staphylococcus aureus]
MAIDKDTVEIVSGVRNGYTLGSPITMVVTNMTTLRIGIKITEQLP